MKKIGGLPAEQRLVILPDEKLDRTPGGIIIPETNQENKPEFGTVVLKGIGDIDRSMKYNIGDRVLYSEYAGTEVKLNLDGEDKTYKIMDQMDVMMIIWEVE